MSTKPITISFAYPAAGIALLFWSGTAIANKIAVQFMDGLTAGILRSLFAGVLALLFIFVLRFPFPESFRDRMLLLVSGVASFAIWPVLMSLGVERTSVGHAALIMALIPVFTVLFSNLVRKQKIKTGWWLGAALAVVGTAFLIINQNQSLDKFNTGSSLAGDLLVLSGSIVCAIGYVAGGHLSSVIGTAATTFWGLSMALIVLVPALILYSGNIELDRVEMGGWLAIAWMTLFSSLAGYVLWFYALARGGISRIGTMQLAMPVVTLFLAVTILKEQLSFLIFAICMCIVIGTYIAHKQAR